MNSATLLIDQMNSYFLLLALLSIFYWSYFIGVNRDERGYQIIGRSAVLTFSAVSLLVGFSLVFHFGGVIPERALADYLLFTYSFSMVLFAISLFIYNRKYLV